MLCAKYCSKCFTYIYSVDPKLPVCGTDMGLARDYTAQGLEHE